MRYGGHLISSFLDPTPSPVAIFSSTFLPSLAQASAIEVRLPPFSAIFSSISFEGGFRRLFLASSPFSVAYDVLFTV